VRLDLRKFRILVIGVRQENLVHDAGILLAVLFPNDGPSGILLDFFALGRSKSGASLETAEAVDSVFAHGDLVAIGGIVIGVREFHREHAGRSFHHLELIKTQPALSLFGQTVVFVGATELDAHLGIKGNVSSSL